MQQFAFLASALAHVVFACVSVWLIASDVRERRLPNRIVAMGTLGILCLLLASSAMSGDWSRLRTSLIAGLCYGALMLVLWLAGPRALGAGDVKLSVMLGLVAGWASSAAAVLWMPLALGCLAGLAGAVQLMRRRRELPFGPVLIAACWLAVVAAYALPAVKLT